MEQSLRRFGLEELMTLIIGDGSLPKLKPHRMPYDEIIRQRFPDIAPQNILMVGDTILDHLLRKQLRYPFLLGHRTVTATLPTSAA